MKAITLLAVLELLTSLVTLVICFENIISIGPAFAIFFVFSMVSIASVLLQNIYLNTTNAKENIFFVVMRLLFWWGIFILFGLALIVAWNRTTEIMRGFIEWGIGVGFLGIINCNIIFFLRAIDKFRAK